MRVASLLAILALVFAGGLSSQARQSTNRPAVYTTEQAEAGRMEIQKNLFGVCTDCHTTMLTGRRGDADELPPISSLPEDYQKLINGNGGQVPPLVGPTFLKRWSARSTKSLSKEFQERFAPPLSEQTRLNIIAYMLQMSGALPGTQPLRMTTDVEIGTLAPK